MTSKTIFRVVAATILAATSVVAQSALKFDVASVKPAAMDMAKLAAQIQSTGQMPKMGAHIEGLRAEYTFMSVKELIIEAYKLKPFEVSGPGWMDNVAGSERYDIVAKMPEGTTREQSREMLQNLLAERFGLKTHHETKEQPVLALVLGKGGLKMKEAPPAEDFDFTSPLKPGETQMETSEGPIRMRIDMKAGGSEVNMGKRGTWKSGFNQAAMTMRMESSNSTMSAFADMMTQMGQAMGGGSHAPRVVDMTGLKGQYAVALEFSMADLMKMAQSAGFGGDVPGLPAGRGPATGDAQDPAGSNGIYSAVANLGLKLETRKAPTDQLVIDHVERIPTEN
jgi:uncharacterized protein (TIGR03435 family)